MNFIARIQVQFRAGKYKNRSDKGGIAYILSAIKQGQVAFDIGSHKAGYLFFMTQSVGKSGKVYAFEPQLPLYHYLLKICKAFKWSNVRVEHLALSNNKGTTTLYVPLNKKSKDTSPGATIVAHSDRKDFVNRGDVAMDTLDNYCSKHDLRPDFLKIDVEGNELRVFQGGLETLKKCKPKILVEIEARHVGREKALETFAFMQSLGYSGFMLNGAAKTPLAEFSFDLHQNPHDKKGYCNNFIFE